MSGVISKLWDRDKIVTLSGHTKHLHRPSPISPDFVPPLAVQNLSFGRIALAAAIARTATTWDDAPADLLEGLKQSALTDLETFVESGSSFALKPHFRFLADTRRSQFAASVDAGLTDLYMNALGYVWRANAACLSSTLNPHADFIYDGGNASHYGVVLAEAHGSFAARTSRQSVKREASTKYKRQVKPYLASMTPFGEVIHGYAVAFGLAPTEAGGFLSLSETKITKPPAIWNSPPEAGTGGDRLMAVRTPIALATQRSNFLLMGARGIIDWIDWARLPAGAAPEGETVEFIRLRYADRIYLVPASWSWRTGFPPWWLEDFFSHPGWWHASDVRATLPFLNGLRFGWFAMEETAGVDFLNTLSRFIRFIQGGEGQLPPIAELRTFQPIGFGISDGEGDAAVGRDADEYPYALFRDGLALLGDPFRGRPLGVLTWMPNEGPRSVSSSFNNQ